MGTFMGGRRKKRLERKLRPPTGRTIIPFCAPTNIDTYVVGTYAAIARARVCMRRESVS